MVLQMLLVTDIGRVLAGFEPSLPGLGIGMIVAIFHDSGNLLFIQISLNIVRR